MPKMKISKQLIEMIASKDNSEFVKSINDKVNGFLSLSIENLAKKVSYVSLDNVVLQPINEIFNNAVVDGSNFVYLLGIENVQLELNTMKKESKWKHFKKKIAELWKNRKYFKKKKLRRKRRKKEEKNLEEKKPISKNSFENYTIYDLAEDLQASLCENFSETTLVYLKKNCIEIIGKDDLGPNVKVSLYLVHTQQDQVYKYFVNDKKGFIDLNLPNRYRFLGEKQYMAGENFTKMLKIFNSLFYNANGYLPNQIFIESILCACPDDFFKGNDIYKSYLKILNFISLKTIRNIKSINEPSKTIISDEVCGNCGIAFNKMMQELGNNAI